MRRAFRQPPWEKDICLGCENYFVAPAVFLAPGMGFSAFQAGQVNCKMTQEVNNNSSAPIGGFVRLCWVPE